MTTYKALRALMTAIAQGNEAAALTLLTASPTLATAALQTGASRAAAAENYLSEIAHHLYAGDTALHVRDGGHQHPHPSTGRARGRGQCRNPQVPRRRPRGHDRAEPGGMLAGHVLEDEDVHAADLHQRWANTTHLDPLRRGLMA